MLAARTVDGLLATARAHAEAGAWVELRTLLGGRAGEAREHPELMTLRAEAELRTGRPREARAWLAEVWPRLEQSGDRAAVRRAVNLLGVAQIELGELDEAERTLGRALELGREDEDHLLVARATNNLATIAHVHGRNEAALAMYQLAIPAYQRLGHPAGLAESYHNMALLLRKLEQLDRADELEQRAIEFAREAGREQLAALARFGRAELCLYRGDAALAEAGARRAARDFGALADPIREADAFRISALAALALGKHGEAAAALERAVALARECGNALIEAESLRARAELHAAAGRRAKARADAAAALAIFDRLNAQEERAGVRKWLAEQG